MDNSSKICLVDMDGTLFDYNGAMFDSLIAVVPPEREDFIRDNKDNYHEMESEPWCKNIMDLIKLQPDWWLNLPKHEPGWDVYYLAEAIGFNTKILTKGPYGKSVPWKEKVECIWKHFGKENAPPIDIVSQDKHGVYGRVLVEDYVPYLEPWLEKRKRGLGILIDQPYNRGWEHENVIRYTGNKKEIAAALTAAFNRKQKQHWQELM